MSIVSRFPPFFRALFCTVFVQVGDALSSSSSSVPGNAHHAEARGVMLGDAHALYRGICDHHDCGDTDRDDGLALSMSMAYAEADYLRMLLGLEGSDDVECDGDGKPICRLFMTMPSNVR